MKTYKRLFLTFVVDQNQKALIKAKIWILSAKKSQVSFYINFVLFTYVTAICVQGPVIKWCVGRAGFKKWEMGGASKLF